MTAVVPGWTTKRTYRRDYAPPPLRQVKVLPIDHWTVADIRALRRKLGVSQTVMAQMLGVHRISLCRWENGTSAVEMTSILRLLSLLDKAPELFFLEPR